MTALGSLFSGYAGLDMAVEAVTGGHTVWHSDIDPGANKILAHHWPDVPNLGDISAVDWSQVQPVDIITGGYPCQPFSMAGRRAGVDDDRHLWPHVAIALSVLRPQWAFFENVRGHLTLGFGEVLRDLSLLRYEVNWTLIRASDVGAPHGRARVFILGRNVGRVRGGVDRRRGVLGDSARQSCGHVRDPHTGSDGHEGHPRTGTAHAPLWWPDHHTSPRDGAQCGEVRLGNGWGRRVLGTDQGSAAPDLEVRSGDVLHAALGGDPREQSAPRPAPLERCATQACAALDAQSSGGKSARPGTSTASVARCCADRDLPVGRVVAAERGPVWSRFVLRELPDKRTDGVGSDLPAASVGAPHGRFRVFIMAWPESRDTDSVDQQGWSAAGLTREAGSQAGPAADSDEVGRDGRAGELGSGRWGQPADSGHLPADADSVGSQGIKERDREPQARGAQTPQGDDADGRSGSTNAAGPDRDTPANPASDGWHEGWPESAGVVWGPDAAQCGGSVAADADRDTVWQQPVAESGGDGAPVVGQPVSWGQFEPAIRRWERLTRPAPAPTETSSRGGQRLSPRFVEWLMGLPEGHVTGVPGLSRNEQLKALGNGVVPQQAEAALRVLLNAMAVAA